MEPTVPQTPPSQSIVPQPTPTASSQTPEFPKNKTPLIAGTAIALILILSIIIIINGQRNSHVLTLPAHQDNTTAATPTPKVTDTAPSVPSNQKARIIVHHSDSSFETFLIPTTNINLFKNSLQPGDTIFKTISPQP